MRLLVVLLGLCLTGCVMVHSLRVEPVDVQASQPFVVESPVKVHLTDGSTVVFEKGITVAEDAIKGEGFRYDVLLRLEEPVVRIPIADVAAVESFQTPVNTGATAVASTGATVGVSLGAFALGLAIFGSCPTIYSMQAPEPLLEAESFSYSIAPGFEARDIDRLGIVFDGEDVLLEVRNEALETHYIDQLQLLAVSHDAGEAVYSDHRDRPLVVGAVRGPVSAVDNTGRQVQETVGLADGLVWRSTEERLRQVTNDDFEDHIELTFSVQPGSDNALVLRLRNSLLNTVLLYDVMLTGQGWRALDWMGADLDRLFHRWRLGSWYRKRMGMRVSVRDNDRWLQVASFGDTGPIAWKELAIPLPRQQQDTVQVRLSYVTDNWRIDQAGLAEILKDEDFSEVPLRQVRDALDAVHETAEENLAADDDRYVISRPGDSLLLSFDTSTLDATRSHTFFVAATGYYIEWMRMDWLQSASAGSFRPRDAALVSAIGRWSGKREEMRGQFDASRIKVR